MDSRRIVVGKTEYRVVEPRYACPRCGESEFHRLHPDRDGSKILCTTCFHQYTPPGRSGQSRGEKADPRRVG